MASTFAASKGLSGLTEWPVLGRINSRITTGLVALAPLLAIATYLVLLPFGNGSDLLRWVILADFIYVMIVAALVLSRVMNMIAARRAKSAGSRLHLRLTALFSLVALVPTVLVAFFAMLTINSSLEGWFSDRIRNAVEASQAAAFAYREEQETGLRRDTQLLANAINFEGLSSTRLNDGQLRFLLSQLEPQLQRDLKELFIVNNLGELRVRGPGSYQFNFEPPTSDEILQASDEITLITDLENGEIRALYRLDAFLNHYLYLGRALDPDLLRLLDETTKTAQNYRQLESERNKILLDFALLYLSFAVILILASIWGGLWFAERLATPIGRLTAAAQKVGDGNLDAQVAHIAGDDEIAILGRYFNQMVRQLKRQRTRLIEGNAQTDRRRRLFDSVLSSITSGVIVVDRSGDITYFNKSAARALIMEDQLASRHLEDVVPEFMPLFRSLDTAVQDVVQKEVKVVRDGRQETLLVRIATRQTDEGRREGFVIAFEDVTDLVSAQRLAAWGDVARRIAHEIKNPLTPIKLSAERLQRKYGPLVGDERDTLDSLTSVIVRQTDDLRRIVDDFSRFARMPEPEKTPGDLADLLQDTIILQENAFPKITFTFESKSADAKTIFDRTLMGQAVTNLIKNACQAVSSLGPDHAGEVRIYLEDIGRRLRLTISDNGPGFPPDRAKLFEPYVTHRAGGTGLGLSIVLKIVEDHGGVLSLKDAKPFTAKAKPGAQVEVLLPHAEAGLGHINTLRKEHG